MRTAFDCAPGRQLATGALLHASIIALWIGTFLLARALEHSPHASLWFPPAAVTFAALLVAGPRVLPALFISCAAATYLTELRYADEVRTGVLVWSSVAFATTHCLAYGLPAALLRSDASHAALNDVTLRSVSRFILLGAAGAALAALMGVAALVSTGLIDTETPGRLVSAWWLGDFVGLITLAPLMIRLIAHAAGDRLAHRAVQSSPFHAEASVVSSRAAWKLAAMGGVTLAMLVAAHAMQEPDLLLALLVVPLVLQLWVVHTESRTAALHGVVLFSLLTVGGGALLDTGEHVVTLQFAAIGLAANTYFGLAVPALYASNARLREQVTRDRLTRVMSRAYFEDRATHEIQRAATDGRTVAMVLFDLDRLKHINDTHGHAAGDAVLAELAARCASTMRPGDLIGRLSGDEFAVLLTDADAAVADGAIGRMRSALDSAPFAGGVGIVTASFGRAVAVPGASDLAELLHAADAAMYADKRRRRGVPEPT